MALPAAFFFSQRLLERLGVEADLQVRVFLRDRDALAVEIEPRQDVHRHRHVVLRHLAGADEVGHRRQDVGAVDAVALGAEHEVVARRAPGGLLLDLDVGHAVLGKEPLLLGDEERRRVGQGDEAELCRLRLRTGALREGAARKCRFRGRHDGERRPSMQRLAPRELPRPARHIPPCFVRCRSRQPCRPSFKRRASRCASVSHRARRTRREAAVAALHKQSAIAVSLFSRHA